MVPGAERGRDEGVGCRLDRWRVAFGVGWARGVLGLWGWGRSAGVQGLAWGFESSVKVDIKGVVSFHGMW